MGQVTGAVDGDRLDGGESAGQPAGGQVPEPEPEGSVPPGPFGQIDPTVPHTARVYLVQRGGNGSKGAYAVDRAAAAMLNKAMGEIGAPDGHVAARENRRVLRRFCQFLARAGVTQFLDLGSGLPLLGDDEVHEVVRAVTPDARVVYVDNDPLVATHARALLTPTPGVGFVQADLRHPRDVLRQVREQGLLDFDQPVAVLLIAMLHCVSDAEDPARIVAHIREGVAVGSYLAMTHLNSTSRPEAAARLQTTARSLGLSTPLVPRPHWVINRYLDGWTVIEPGLVDAELWHPDDPEGTSRGGESWLVAGLARKDADLGNSVTSGNE